MWWILYSRGGYHQTGVQRLIDSAPETQDSCFVKGVNLCAAAFLELNTFLLTCQAPEMKWILPAGREQKSLPPVPCKMRGSLRTSYTSAFHPCSWNAFSIVFFFLFLSLSFSWATRKGGVWQDLPVGECGSDCQSRNWRTYKIAQNILYFA